MTYIRKSIIQGIDSNGQEIDIKVNSTGKIMTDDTSVNSLSDKFQRTNFNELRTTNRISQMNFKPTWGVSTLRYTQDMIGGANISEVNGEYRLFSGNGNSQYATLKTKERGQYVAGSIGSVGIGIRLPSIPGGSKYAEWGYSDLVTSGFFFGADSNGLYVGYIFNSIKTKIYQNNWNCDKLDGDCASKLNIDLSLGVICEINFSWYGYGDIEYVYYVYDNSVNELKRVVVHHMKINSRVSIEDPNQPLCFKVQNDNSGSGVELFVGGHQFSIIDSGSESEKRYASEIIRAYTLGTNTNWQPLIAIRKKSTFGPSSRVNSTKVKFKNLEIASSSELEVRLTINSTTNNLTWASPTGWDTTESSVETKISAGTQLTTSVVGYPTLYSFVNTASTRVIDQEFEINEGNEVIIWVRRLSATGTMTIKLASMQWVEEW